MLSNVARLIKNGTSVQLSLNSIAATPKHIDVSSRWLLDQCKCPKCYDTATLQRKDGPQHWGDESKQIRSVSLINENKDMRIDWTDTSGHEHPTLIDWKTLESLNSTMVYPKRNLWNADLKVTKIAYKTITSKDEGERQSAMKEFYRNMIEKGVCTISGTPHQSSQATKDLGTQLANLYTSHDGVEWTINAKNDKNYADSAYSTEALHVHTDGTYCECPPGVLAFHMLEKATTGGHTLLVDGFEAAERLKRESPKNFDVLRTIRIPHKYIEPGSGHYVYRRPIIVADENDNVEQITYNPYDRDDLATLDPSKSPYSVDDFYTAYAHFSRVLRDPIGMSVGLHEPGEFMLVDNWRVLHGRTAFTLDGETQRRLYGVYLCRHSLLSRSRLYGVL